MDWGRAERLFIKHGVPTKVLKDCYDGALTVAFKEVTLDMSKFDKYLMERLGDEYKGTMQDNCRKVFGEDLPEFEVLIGIRKRQ